MNRVYTDGAYTIEAVAYQAGTPVGQSSANCPVTLNNATTGAVTIDEPENDDSIVSDDAPVSAQADGPPSRVKFWLFGEGDVILAGTDTTTPYQCSISSSIAENGVFDLQAVAYYDSVPAVSYSVRRRILLVNDAVTRTSVAALGALSNDAEVYLVDIPVVVGTSSATGDAFYVEDINRASGIRIESSTSVATGQRVMVSGTLRKSGTGIIERHIDATRVWDLGPASAVPGSLGMPNAALGGVAPAGTVGIVGGKGPYNLGMLVRTWGKVTYVGSDFAYIDDGIGWQDENLIDGPIIVPLDGSAIPSQHPEGVAGICVFCGSLDKPGIGDYVAITGLSSTAIVDQRIVRYLRVRSQDAIG